MTNTGRARIACGPDGERLEAVYVPKRGELSNGDHAWVNVTRNAKDPQCYIIEANHHRGDFHINIKRILSLHEKLMPKADIPWAVERHNVSPTAASVMWANTVMVCKYSDGEWDNDPHECLIPAIEAAKGKAMDYHCRAPWYVKTPEEVCQEALDGAIRAAWTQEQENRLRALDVSSLTEEGMLCVRHVRAMLINGPQACEDATEPDKTITALYVGRYDKKGR